MTMSKFQATLKMLRTNRGITQEELADKTGLTRSCIGNYEAGRREPSFETLEILADFFNVSMSVFLESGKDEKTLCEENEMKRICKDICGGNGSADEMCELVSLYFGEEVSDTVRKFMLLDEDDKKDIIDLMASKLSRDKYSNGTA